MMKSRRGATSEPMSSSNIASSTSPSATSILRSFQE
jgi:hypothetical protein